MDALTNPQGPGLCSGHSSSVPGRQPGRRLTLAPTDLRELCCKVRRGALPALRIHKAPPGPRLSGAPRGAPCATAPAQKLVRRQCERSFLKSGETPSEQER